MLDERRKKYISALESGDYKQHFGSMRGPTDDCLCAVGLAFELIPDRNWNMLTWDSDAIYESVRAYYNCKPLDIMAWNDGPKLSFPDIAKKLKKEWSKC